MSSRVPTWTRQALVTVLVAFATGTIAYFLGASDSQPSARSAATATATSSASVSPNVQTGFSDCGFKKPVAKPQSMTMTCADGGTVVSDVDWRIWDANSALGAGTVTSNDCDPSCADGTNIEYAAMILMDQVESNGAGPQFTRAVLVFGDETPNYGGNKVNVYALDLYTD